MNSDDISHSLMQCKKGVFHTVWGCFCKTVL